MPRDVFVVGAVRQSAQCVSDLTGMAWVARQLGNLAVGGNPALGDATDNGIDAVVCASRQRAFPVVVQSDPLDEIYIAALEDRAVEPPAYRL